ncbi:MAG: nitroreductase family protein [Rubrivivax sp.]|nr:nitroreductase family protein [Rubrivivax sp.]MCW5611268.1 nitroreductase family protein [Rubrivivax sp.]
MPRNDALLQGLLSRRSLGGKHLVEPGPDDAQLQLLAQAALRAPDHALLTPYRLRVVRGAAREAMARLFERAALDAGKDAAGAALDAERARAAPVTVVLVARIDQGHPLVPAHEQWIAVGAALANLLNAAHALGFAGKMLSGAKVRHPALVQAFCAPGETLVGWVALGTDARAASGHGTRAAGERGTRATAAELLADWTGA